MDDPALCAPHAPLNPPLLSEHCAVLVLTREILINNLVSLDINFDLICMISQSSPSRPAILVRNMLWMPELCDVIFAAMTDLSKGAGSGGAGGAEGAPPLWKSDVINIHISLNLRRMKKENAKFVILKQQNLGKSHFCKQKRVPACALLYALWCVVSNVGFSSIKIDKLSQGCRTTGPE